MGNELEEYHYEVAQDAWESHIYSSPSSTLVFPAN